MSQSVFSFGNLVLVAVMVLAVLTVIALVMVSVVQRWRARSALSPRRDTGDPASRVHARKPRA